MKIQTSLISHVVSAVVGLALSAVLLNAGQPSATQTAKPHPTPHPRPTPTGTPSATPTASPSTTPIVTPTPIPTPPDNTFLAGLYAYYELDEASGAAMDSYGTRTLGNFGNPVGTAAGKINTSRNFPGGNAYFCSLNTTDFSPGSNHFFFSFWAKAGNLTQGQSDTGFLSKTGTANNRQWIVFYNNTTKKPKLNVSLDDAQHVSGSRRNSFCGYYDVVFHRGRLGWNKHQDFG